MRTTGTRSISEIETIFAADTANEVGKSVDVEPLVKMFVPGDHEIGAPLFERPAHLAHKKSA